MTFFRNCLLFICFLVVVKSQGFRDDNQACRTPTGETANCIPANQCKAIIDVLQRAKRPWTPSVRKQINEYYCGFADNIAHVCCPQGSIPIEDGSTPEVQQEPPNVSNHKNLYLIPPNCGQLDLQNRIRNGQNADLNEFPWMALLRYRSGAGSEFRCGGSIINKRYILTAAHCLLNLQTQLLDVRVGEYNTSSSIDCISDIYGKKKCIMDPIQNVAIEEIIPHPEFNSKTIENDIGLLRVANINLVAENARPVCLPLDDNRLDTAIKRVTVTGWGFTDDVSERKADVLQKVDLSVVDIGACREAYSKNSKARLTYKQLCAGGGNKNKDACAGDSGGPLQVAKLIVDEPRYIQYGIVSFGTQLCGSHEDIPGVYTRVAHYMDWILDNIRS
ncbi:serine protease grass-like [Diabrotica undecimpunctata]|uniref:serine protease grass-like n=1 Tax=Diabrotica undecimpunctata TaxID=50387 RepID=UPI003B632646